MNNRILLTYFKKNNSSFLEFFIDYCLYLQKQGKEVFVITDNEILIKPLKRLKIDVTLIKLHKAFKLFGFFYDLCKFSKFLKVNKIKKVHAFDEVVFKYISYLRFNKKLKFFVTYQGQNKLDFNHKYITKFFVYSDVLKEKLLTLKVNEKKVVLLEPSINTDKFNLKAVTDERFRILSLAWNTDDNTPIFLSVMEKYGEFYQKLMKSVTELKKTKKEFKVFILVKDPDFFNKIEDEKKNLNNLRLSDYIGFVFNDIDTDCVFKIANCFINENRVIYFSFYNMIAHAFGRFVITSNKGEGVNIIDQDITGKFFNMDDYSSLTSQMLWFLDKSKSERNKIQDNIIKTFKPAKLDVCYKKMMDEYK